jgi:hypothetical protein
MDFCNLYLQEILKLEAPKNSTCHGCESVEGVICYLSCFGGNMSCVPCALAEHQLLPFHKLERWNGKYFEQVTLHQLDFVLHLGHDGMPCYSQALHVDEAVNGEDLDIVDEKDLEKAVDEENWQYTDNKVLKVVHVMGVHLLEVKWCQYHEAPDKHL